MTLPHPKDETNPGDFFYPGAPDIQFADTPGPAGSRAVEFGEDGLSSAINRGFYALLKNIEYVYNPLATDLARPSFVSWTPAGGSGVSYTFTGVNLFVGHADLYLPETQAIRDSLIGVLDGNYNELIDPTTGDKIVVKEIKNNGDTATVVGTEFYDGGAIVRFKRVHPVTGVSGSDYTIPDGTAVRFAVGVRAILENIPDVTEGKYLQDMMYKGFPRGVSEIHASSFVRDGSRKMLGDINMDSNDINNAVIINSKSATPAEDLDIRGSNNLLLSALDADATGTEGLIKIDDRLLTSAINFNDSEPSVYAPDSINTSVLGALNSHGRQIEALSGVNLISYAFYFNDATGEITWDDIIYSVGGEIRKIDAAGAGSGFTPTLSDTDLYLVIDSTGAINDREVSTGFSFGDIALYNIYYDSGTPEYSYKTSLTRYFSTKSDALQLTVGYKPGSDFGDLQKALDFVAHLGTTYYMPGVPSIKILDYVLCGSTIEVKSDVRIFGSYQDSTIYTQANAANDGINCGNYRVIIENLTLRPQYASADGGNAILNPGSGSIIRDVSVDASVSNYRYAYIVKVDGAARKNILIDNIYTVDEVIRGFVDTNSDAENVKIRNCNFRLAGVLMSGNPIISLAGSNCTVEGCYIWDAYEDLIRIGHNGLVKDCILQMNLGANGYPIVVKKFVTGTGIHTARIVNCSTTNGFYSIYIDYNSETNIFLDVEINGCTFVGQNLALYSKYPVATLAEESLIKFINNYVEGGYRSLYLENTERVIIEGNHFESVPSDSILYITGSTKVTFDGNTVSDWPTYGIAYLSSDTNSYCSITNNVFVNKTDGGSRTCIYSTGVNCSVKNNLFLNDTGVEADEWVTIEDYVRGCTVDGNVFDKTKTHSVKADDTLDAGNEKGFLVSNNYFMGVGENGSAVIVHGFEGSIISSNSFVPPALSSASGAAIEIGRRSDSALYKGDETLIINNIISEYRGKGRDWASNLASTINLFTRNSDYPVNCSISNNILISCGSDTDSKDCKVIRSDGYCDISLNYIYNPKGPGSGGSLAVIEFGEYSRVCNNHIKANALYLARDTTLLRISGEFSKISDNYVMVTASRELNLLRGISQYLGSSGIGDDAENCMISNNFIVVDDTNVITGTAASIYLPIAEDYIQLLGNRATGDIDAANLSTYSIVIGNMGDTISALPQAVTADDASAGGTKGGNRQTAGGPL